MKFDCRCGHSLSDAADADPRRAMVVAEQDREELSAGLERRAPEERLARLSALSRAVFECSNCGRLALPDPISGAIRFFRPEEPAKRSVLGSIHGNAYPVALIGGWQDWQTPPRGDLHWGTSGDRPGGFEEFADWEALERRYHEVAAVLRAEGRLSRAWLHRGETTVHEWR